jgi:hypothetical protein
VTEHFPTGLKKPGQRGMAQASPHLIEKMAEIAEAMQPITGRGIGYKLFTAKLIPSMATNEMAKVYRLPRKAREQGDIPWHWIVDETREIERVSTWDNPADYVRTVMRAYRRDFWNQQPHRLLVASEKGTVRGVVKSVLDQFAVGFLPLHGFSSATTINDLAEDDDGRPLIVLYIGDFDPSGLYMSEVDLPLRIALTSRQTAGLPSFPVTDERRDPRYRWYVNNHGKQCWELDAMDPRDLRECVRYHIRKQIEPEAWQRCETVYAAEKESLTTFLNSWKKPRAEDIDEQDDDSDD